MIGMNRDTTGRRMFLGAMAGVPGLPMLGGGADAAEGDELRRARDVIRELGVRPFINAAGTFTSLTGSLMRPEVVAAMEVASRQYVKLEDLRDAVGASGSRSSLHCPAALVTAGCASALCAGDGRLRRRQGPGRIRRLPDTAGMKNEVIVQKSHRVGFDHAIRNTGVKLVEVVTRQQMESAIGEKTAMMFFLNFADPEGEIHHEEFVAIARSRRVPTLIDAAADVPPVENLWRFTKLGFDLVAFSGGKGLRGPQSSGLLLGRKDLIEAAKLNNCPDRRHARPDEQGQQGRDRRHARGTGIVPAGGSCRSLEGVGGPLPPDRRGPRRNSRTCGPRSSSPRSPTRCRTSISAGIPRRISVPVGDGEEAPRGQAQHRGEPGLAEPAGDRRLDDAARRRRNRRPPHPRGTRRWVTVVATPQ